MIKLNLNNTGIDQKEIMKYKEQIENIHKDLRRRADDEEDFVLINLNYYNLLITNLFKNINN